MLRRLERAIQESVDAIAIRGHGSIRRNQDGNKFARKIPAERQGRRRADCASSTPMECTRSGRGHLYAQHRRHPLAPRALVRRTLAGWSAWLAAGVACIAVAAPPAPPPAVHEVDWRTTPLDLNLRGVNGARFLFRCPPGRVMAAQVTGSGPYTDGSSICAAGVHAGVITAANGGLVTIEVRPGASHFRAALRHYVQSVAYDGFWIGSFVVIPGRRAGHSP
ncbi:MAG: hypothetical protein JSR15_09875 [Proteobacteria bacterium]|nr:hypothetical protein [Pseudomonadota bacterium]